MCDWFTQETIDNSGLPPRSLLSHPAHHRLQFPPLNGTGVPLCSYCSNFHKPGACIHRWLALCMEWASFAQRLLPRVLSNIFCSSMKTILFSCARVGKASEQ